MIQRIQSIYLAFSGILLAILFFITIKNLNLIITLILINNLFSFILIFLYKNRKLQMKICLTHLILLIILIISTISQNYLMHSNDINSFITTYYIDIIIPIISILFVVLAYKGVKKDENLIKSMDRLR